jgi:hypothetical protein
MDLPRARPVGAGRCFEALMVTAMEHSPHRIVISSLTWACPVCHVQPGEVCELYFGEDENVHVERIWVAVKMDNAEQDRLNRVQVAVQCF